MKGKILRILAGILAAGMLVGCRDAGPNNTVFVRTAAGDRIRMAVLPFDNVTKEPDAGRILTNNVLTYLLSTGQFDVVEPGAVDKAVTDARLRVGEGLEPQAAQKLGQSLGVRLLLVGLVEDYDYIRIGSDTYPAVSFSARIIDAQNGNIVWAASVSRTGADNVKVFDMGRISSMGKLCKLAVSTMAQKLAASSRQIAAALELGAPSVQASGPREAGPAAPTVPTAAVEAAQNPPAPASAGGGKSKDESAVFTEDELKALLIEVESFTRGEVTYSKHFFPTVAADYVIGSGPEKVEVKLLDCGTRAKSEALLAHYNTGETPKKFNEHTGYSGISEFNTRDVDIAVGRFALRLRGPESKNEDVQNLAMQLVKSME